MSQIIEYEINSKIPHVPLNPQSLSNIIENLKVNNLKFHQFYNTEFSAGELAFFDYMLKYGDFDKKFYELKILNKTFYDIETKFDPLKAPDSVSVEFPITSITIYNNIKNLAIIYFLKDSTHEYTEESLKKEVEEIYKEKINYNETYNVKDIEIQIKIFNKEEELLIEFFRDLLNLNTLFLIGFNSSLFDDPYTVNRLIKLIGENNAFKIISEFGVEKFGVFSIEQPDYIRADLLKLYKPVDAGGMGLGKSLPSYKLNYIAQEELNIKKLELTGNFNEVYKNSPALFATYNFLDVILTYKLAEKLRFFEDTYSLSKIGNCSVRSGFIGRSFIFKYRNTINYMKNKKIVRHIKFNKEIYHSF